MLKICLFSFSSSPPVLELPPSLLQSLTRRAYDGEADPTSDYALAMRVKGVSDKKANFEQWSLSEYPFAREREAVIAHELAHLKLNHAWGTQALNALLATAAVTIYFRPKFFFFPLLCYVIATPVWTRHCELEADRVTSLKMGPEVAQALVHRLQAQLQLEAAIMKKFSIDDTPYRQVILDRVYNMLFHIPIKRRLAALNDLAKAKKSKGRDQPPSALSAWIHDSPATTVKDKHIEAMRRMERGD